MTLSEESFLKCVAKHELTIIRDDGVSRHLRFMNPGSRNQYFELITWPWFLCYCGDMGCYVFERLEDMFEFFRTKDDVLRTYPGYWAEKVQAADRCDGLKKWSPARFESKAREWFDEWLEDCDLDGDGQQDAREAFEDCVIGDIDCGKDAAYTAAARLEINGQHPLQDFFEVDSDEFTLRYLWCCYALVWGIKQYDAAKAAADKAAKA